VLRFLRTNELAISLRRMRIRFTSESRIAGHFIRLRDFFWSAFLSKGALVKYFFILAALTLTACALPGASGTNSFMSAMHPTQEFCASRGLTLDATTKQCVAPQPTKPPTSAPAEAVTGSLPQVAQAQPQSQPAPSAPSASSAPPAAPALPPPQERQRAAPSVPVEPGAVIYSELSQDFDLMSELAHFVRASGYRCDSISALQPLPPSRGFKLVCNRFNYRYAIENKDGRSIVTVE
jgi:hypothetical protein